MKDILYTKEQLDKLSDSEVRNHLIDSIRFDDMSYHEELSIYHNIRVKTDRLNFYRSFIIDDEHDFDNSILNDKVAMKNWRIAMHLSRIIKLLGVENYYNLLLNEDKKKQNNLHKLYED